VILQGTEMKIKAKLTKLVILQGTELKKRQNVFLLYDDIFQGNDFHI